MITECHRLDNQSVRIATDLLWNEIVVLSSISLAFEEQYEVIGGLRLSVRSYVYTQNQIQWPWTAEMLTSRD